MRTIDAEAVGMLSRARYAALSAWLQGLPADQVLMRWMVQNETESAPTPKAATARLNTLLAGARQRARQHGQSSLVRALTPVNWTSKTRRCAVEALRRLETMGAPVPKPWQEIGLWLSPRTGVCLAAAGVQSFDELIALCNRYGHTWFRRVPGLGAVGAGRVSAFLCQHSSVFPALDVRAMHASYALPTAPRGLPPGALATHAEDPFAAMSQAVMRSASCDAQSLATFAWQSVQAESTVCESRDDEALQQWLAQWRGDSATRRAYAREVVRFTAWMRIEQGKVLSATLPSDCVAYATFLSCLSPDSKWCGPRVPRVVWIENTWVANPAWRPFTGSLSSRSQAFSLLVLRLLFAWLVRQRYLVTNPWIDINHVPAEARQHRPAPDIPNRFWEVLFRWLDHEARGGAQGRLWRATLLLLAETGLSCEDAAVSRVTDVPVAGHTTPSAPVTRQLVVQRQDRMTHAVPVSPRLFAALRAHWEDRDDSPCYALGYPRGICLPKKARGEATAEPSHYSARGLRQLVQRAMRAFTLSLASGQRDLGQWATQVRSGNLSHGIVALALPERLQGKDGPLQITVRHRHRR